MHQSIFEWNVGALCKQHDVELEQRVLGGIMQAHSDGDIVSVKGIRAIPCHYIKRKHSILVNVADTFKSVCCLSHTFFFSPENIVSFYGLLSM